MSVMGAIEARRDLALQRAEVRDAQERRDVARTDEREAARRRVEAERDLASARSDERRAHRVDRYA